jgi:hypothetical protein
MVECQAAVDLEGTCELYYRDEKIAEGACTAQQVNAAQTVPEIASRSVA